MAVPVRGEMSVRMSIRKSGNGDCGFGDEVVKAVSLRESWKVLYASFLGLVLILSLLSNGDYWSW
jgi:hypothetical protein